MDRPSTIILCKVAPGIGFKVVRLFSASATNSGSFYQPLILGFGWETSTVSAKDDHASTVLLTSRFCIDYSFQAKQI